MTRPMGVLVNEIHTRSPLHAAGVAAGDVILAVAGHTIDDPQALKYRIATLSGGQTADLTVWRRGRERQATLKLIAPHPRTRRAT
jgi:serine protease Do